MPEFTFPLTGVPCKDCAENVVYCLNQDTKPNYFTFKNLRVSPNLKKLIVEVEDPNVTEAEIRRYIVQTLETTPYKLVEEDAQRYWVWGTTGLVLGVIVLILSVTTGLTFWPLKWAVAAVSVGLTVILGEESYRKAKIEILRGKPAMDSLFILSTGTAMLISILSLVIPGLPIMFETSLLIFGFRQIGMALQKSMYATARLPVRYQRLATKTQPVNRDPKAPLRPGEVLQIKAGDMLPIDGWLLPLQGQDADFQYPMDVSKIRGSYLPEYLQAGDVVSAGMVTQVDCQIQVGLGHGLRYFPQKPKAVCPEGQIWVYPDPLQDQIRILTWSDNPTHLRRVEFALSVQDFNAIDSQQQFSEILNALRLDTVSKLPLFTQQQLPRLLVNYAERNDLWRTASALTRLEKELEEASSKAAPIQDKVDHALGYFLPLVVGVSFVSGAIVAYFFSPLIALQCMISILVAACPCTLGFVTPLVMDFARTKGKEAGVVLSQSDTIQRLEEIDTILLDIHGTATTGKTVAQIKVVDPSREQEIFLLLARMEQQSAQHIGKAIYAAVNGDTLLRNTKYPALQVTPYSAGGIGAEIDGKNYVVGNANLLKNLGISLIAVEPNTNYLLEKIGTQYQILATIPITDPLRSDTPLAVKQFKNRGFKVGVLSGTDPKTAEQYVQLMPGIDVIYAGLADGQAKAAKIRELQGENYQISRILMIGDGANDGPAMQTAYASIAMSHTLSDEGAQYQAKARILNGKMLAVVDALDIAQLAMWRLKLNLYLSLIYNLSVILLTNFLVLALGVVLHPGICAALMVIQIAFIILSTYYFKRQPLPTKNLLNHGVFQEPSAGRSAEQPFELSVANVAK